MIISNFILLYNFINISYIYLSIILVYNGLYYVVKNYNETTSKNSIITYLKSLFIKNSNNKQSKEFVIEPDNSSDTSESGSSYTDDVNTSDYKRKCYKNIERNLDNKTLEQSKDNSNSTSSILDTLNHKSNLYKKTLKKSLLNYDISESKFIINTEELIQIAKNYYDPNAHNKIIIHYNDKWYLIGKNIYKELPSTDHLLLFCMEKLKKKHDVVDKIDKHIVSLFKFDVINTAKKQVYVFGLTYLV